MITRFLLIDVRSPLKKNESTLSNNVIAKGTLQNNMLVILCYSLYIILYITVIFPKNYIFYYWQQKNV